METTKLSLEPKHQSPNCSLRKIQEHAPIQSQGEIINLIGIDDSHEGLDRIERLMIADTVNILLIHDTYFDAFGDAADVGIDLTLVGHTHGGQPPYCVIVVPFPRSGGEITAQPRSPSGYARCTPRKHSRSSGVKTVGCPKGNEVVALF